MTIKSKSGEWMVVLHDEREDERHVFHCHEDDVWKWCNPDGRIYRCRICKKVFPYMSIDDFIETEGVNDGI